MKYIIVTLFGLMCSNSQGADKPLKVFILAGDENMLEQAPIDGAAGSLATTIKENPRFKVSQGPERGMDKAMLDLQEK